MRLTQKNDVVIKKKEENHKILDYETGEYIDLNSPEAAGLISGIVGYENDNIIIGYFTPNPTKNFIAIDPTSKRTLLGIDLDRFDKDTFYFNGDIGIYQLRKDESLVSIKEKESTFGVNSFPYKFVRRYDAEGNMHLFKDRQLIDTDFHLKYQDQLAYTFGLEFETSCGYIPQERCFQTGLIPLRDGSIPGLEYATVVMNKNTGPALIKNQVEELSKRTRFNKECSLHIHLGGYPIESQAILRLWNLLASIQYSLEDYLPRNAFNTGLWKATHKDYCSILSKRFTSMNTLYKWLSMGSNYFGSLTQAHPADTQRNSKWNVKTRYLWANFTGLCFYRTVKTIEFRMLAPTYNYNKIIGWLYIFNALLQFAERSRNIMPSESDIVNIIQTVYPTELASSLTHFLEDCRKLKEAQEVLHDYCGELYFIDEVVFNKDYDF